MEQAQEDQAHKEIQEVLLAEVQAVLRSRRNQLVEVVEVEVVLAVVVALANLGQVVLFFQLDQALAVQEEQVLLGHLPDLHYMQRAAAVLKLLLH